VQKKTIFDDVSNNFLLPEIEEEIIKIWQKKNVFKRTIDEKKTSKKFTFYEGPPTANGIPGIHHVLARVLKDLILRYKTMQNYKVERKAGWDTHGLPVELEIEKQLGLTNKNDIEKYGIEEFNAKCKDSVFKYVKEWEKLTNRIGYWVDMDNPYITYENNYIESGWWIFKQLWENDLIFRDFRVTPQCGRCETSLSSHEIALGYKENTIDPSVFIKFKINMDQKHLFFKKINKTIQDIAIVAWTTTPWTLPANTALAINPNASYALIKSTKDSHEEYLIIAEELIKTISEKISSETETIFIFKGELLDQIEYFPIIKINSWENITTFQLNSGEKIESKKTNEYIDITRKIIIADFVGTDEGTGIVHIAPAFGDEDYKLGQLHKLYFIQHIDSKGNFYGGPYKGMFIKKADKEIINHLIHEKSILLNETIKHTYPFCWRCDDPIIYYAKPSWYIKTTAVKKLLIQGNKDYINWIPEHIKSGRFGEWLEGNIDWAFSRERYWGTPLPFWECNNCANVICIGSFEELKIKANLDNDIQDPHRPYIDNIKIVCEKCNKNMQRVSEVADAWFDSGAMPYAQWHYPFENQDSFLENFPADFITEGMDQTRGWFYTLHALATLLYSIGAIPEQISFKNCISHGIILDGKGQKMSKSRGNAIEPFEVIDKHGADAIRWYMYTSSPPGNTRRFSSELVEESSRKTFTTLWNIYSFFVTYANLASFKINKELLTSSKRTELDRWILSELHQTIKKTSTGLDNYEPSEAARPITQFIDQLSNWYIRRNRRRFWKTDNSTDSIIAMNILYECLLKIIQISAPFIPFLSESIYQNLAKSQNEKKYDSIHLTSWPVFEEQLIDEELSEKLKLIQKMISLGRRTRQQSSIKIRQPLAKIIFITKNKKEEKILQESRQEIMEELNVKNIEINDFNSSYITYAISINKAILGPKIGREVNKLNEEIMKMEPIQILEELHSTGHINLNHHDLSFKDINIKVSAIENYSAAQDSGYIAILDLQISQKLELEGAAREFIRHIQNQRQKSNFNVTDRIEIIYENNNLVEKILKVHQNFIANETLATAIIQKNITEDFFEFKINESLIKLCLVNNKLNK
jgi:isoleucyl-tRNA synthetase|tara:strand:+ start:565 stop:3855 length:3291 start_codon:yes stop_codon:yes gene_type:complete